MIVMMTAQKSVLSLFQRKDLIDASTCLDYLMSFSDEQFRYLNIDISMKHSQYTISKSSGRTYVLYNTLFNSMLTLSDTEFAQYEALEFTDLELLEPLVNNGFLIPDYVDEYKRYDYYKGVLSDQLPIPMHYTLTVTSRCNARCIYCYEAGIEPSDMSLDVAKAFVKTVLHSDGGIEITWFGGEPLLKPDLISYISSELKKFQREFNAGIITNGSLLTKEMIENQFPLWNIKWVQITLDGMAKEYLKRKRYYNSSEDIFNRVIENIGYLESNQIPVSIRLNIDTDNQDECIKVAHYLKDKFRESDYVMVYPSFLYGSDRSLQEEHERVDCASNVYALFPPELDLLTCTAKVHPCFITQRHSVVIDTDGSILACDGDIGRQHTKYADIFAVSNFDTLEKPFGMLPKVRKLCETCPYFPKCGGGCVNSYGNSCQYDACFMERYKTEFLLNRLMQSLK